MEKQNLTETYKSFQRPIDSLVKAGYKFHFFNRDFEPSTMEEALQDSATGAQSNPSSYWFLLKQLNEQVPDDLPVYLFTSNQLKRFSGARPAISMNLKWSTYTLGDTLSKSIAKAYKTLSDSIRILIANSNPNATIYTSTNIQGNGNNIYEVSNSNNKIFVRSKYILQDTVEVDTSTLDIAIYTDQFANDANYLKAAINAIKQYTKLNLQVSLINDTSSIKPGLDWLFWLSEKPFSLQKHPANLFIYAKGKEQLINSFITTAGTASINNEPIHLSRLISTSNNNDEVEWKDGFGHVILSHEKAGNNIYRFHSRFNPEWNDLTWSSAFTEMIFDLLIKNDLRTKSFDKRTVDESQIQPIILKDGKTFDKEKFVEKTDLSKLCWLIAFVVFCIERFILLNPYKRTANA